MFFSLTLSIMLHFEPVLCACNIRITPKTPISNSFYQIGVNISPKTPLTAAFCQLAWLAMELAVWVWRLRAPGCVGVVYTAIVQEL